MNVHAWAPVALLFTGATVANYLHCTLGMSPSVWSEGLQSLYFLPIILAGMRLGIFPAVGVALGSGLSRALVSAMEGQEPVMVLMADSIVFVCAGLLTARLSRTGFLKTRPVPPSVIGPALDTDCAKAPPVVSQIVTNMIHRFRTPVSSIEGAVWLLEEDSIPEEKREEFLRIIRKEVKQLDSALSDILEYARPREPRFREANLAQLLEDAVRVAGVSDRRPRITFNQDLPSLLPAIWCDPDQIRKLIQSLITNAIQAMPAGGEVAISVRVEQDRLCICVKDRGRGIPPTSIKRVFDPFFTTRENSLGLGLTMARQIAIAHGGSIIVGDTSENGTSVQVELPVRSAHELRTNTGGGGR